MKPYLIHCKKYKTFDKGISWVLQSQGLQNYILHGVSCLVMPNFLQVSATFFMLILDSTDLYRKDIFIIACFYSDRVGTISEIS